MNDNDNLVMRIARSFTANSQIVKKCDIDGNGMMTAIINAGIYAGSGSERTLEDFNKDIESFVYDCNRELESIGLAGNCTAANIRIVVPGNDNLVNLKYEFQCKLDEKHIEMVKCNEWIVNMI